MTRSEAIDLIVAAAARAKDPDALLQWAAHYAKAGRDMTGYDWQNQARITLVHLTGWRGPNAAKVRAFLKTEAFPA